MHVEFIISAYREDQYPPPDKPEVAFAGRSNVGKSSLINRLVNRRKLARTSATPGRTQAINFFNLGDRLYLVDLPGYGFARVPVKVKKSWGRMVETYLRNRSNLASIIVIMDIRRDPSDGDKELFRWLNRYGVPAIPVLTKADKVSRQATMKRTRVIQGQLEGIAPEKPTVFSAKSGVGRDEIWKKIDAVSAI
ncbi:MAG: YihA family ribosome biogenesis GTP-binding protein [Deltaproteobacteria bacterium]|nr:YihA family ribosome biogenesis GTP-binding protein [Deltaproteobacteria bacterium]